MASVGFRRDNGPMRPKRPTSDYAGGTAAESSTCGRAWIAVNFRTKMPRPRLFTISSIRFFDRQHPSARRSEPKSCELSSSPPYWPCYQCQPIANAFTALTLCGMRIPDHMPRGGCGCRDMREQSAGLREDRRAGRRRASERPRLQILRAGWRRLRQSTDLMKARPGQVPKRACLPPRASRPRS